MKNILLHIGYILTALLMLGGIFFWSGVATIAYDYYVLGIDYWHESPTSVAPTYVAIPTVPSQGDPASTAIPQITVTSAPTETPQPPTDTPVAEPTSTSAPAPTAVPTEAATASPQEPTEPVAAIVPVCPTLKNEVLLIEGTSTLPVDSGLLLMYDSKVVGGGSIKPGGVFSIPLANAPRVAGDHTIDVVRRGTENHVHPVFVKRTTCTLAL